MGEVLAETKKGCQLITNEIAAKLKVSKANGLNHTEVAPTPQINFITKMREERGRTYIQKMTLFIMIHNKEKVRNYGEKYKKKYN